MTNSLTTTNKGIAIIKTCKKGYHWAIEQIDHLTKFMFRHYLLVELYLLKILRRLIVLSVNFLLLLYIGYEEDKNKGKKWKIKTIYCLNNKSNHLKFCLRIILALLITCLIYFIFPCRNAGLDINKHSFGIVPNEEILKIGNKQSNRYETFNMNQFPDFFMSYDNDTISTLLINNLKESNNKITFKYKARNSSLLTIGTGFIDMDTIVFYRPYLEISGKIDFDKTTNIWTISFNETKNIYKSIEQ